MYVCVSVEHFAFGFSTGRTDAPVKNASPLHTRTPSPTLSLSLLISHSFGFLARCFGGGLGAATAC